MVYSFFWYEVYKKKLYNQRVVSVMVNISPKIKDIAKASSEHGGRALLVGGAVRDHYMGRESKDYDVEIYGLDSKSVEALLSQFGTVLFVGKSFGVYRIAGLDVDFSLPRKDSYGRKPEVVVDPHMSYHDAFMRRDLTMNAMGIDLHTGELIDPFNGRDDIKNKILRTPNPEFFVQDPLRLFRVMQFIGRFAMQPDEQLNNVCMTMDISKISLERIAGEIEKLFLQSSRPSLGLRWLTNIKRLQEIFPELFATIGIPQRADFHPEGDVFEHSMQALDAAASYEYENDNKKLVMLSAALCHDLGKVTTTECVDGVYHAYGHAAAGVAPAKKLLSRMTLRSDVKEAVPKLVKYHMEPIIFVHGHAKAAAYKRLALKLSPQVNLFDLALLSKADQQGRNGQSQIPLEHDIPLTMQFIAQAETFGVMHEQEPPLLQGADIMHLVQPGPAMGRMLKKAYEIQIEEDIVDKQDLLRRLLE